MEVVVTTMLAVGLVSTVLLFLYLWLSDGPVWAAAEFIAADEEDD